jgi:CcmD family protein
MDKNIFMKALLVTLAVSLVLPASAANGAGYEPSDWMRTNGMIFIVLGVLIIIFAGLFIYLWMIDRKVKKLENQLNQPNHE